MCYSAQVQQSLHKLARQFGATIDHDHFQVLFERRLEDKSVKVSRALEQNFLHPTNEPEARIRELAERFRSAQAQAWEAELFRQKKRLPDRAATPQGSG